MTDEQTHLPVTPGQAYDEDEVRDPNDGPAFETDAHVHPDAAEVPAWRLIATLAVAGALAGLLIVMVFQWAQPRILAYKAGVLADAIEEVLGAPDHYETLFVQDGQLTPTPPVGVDTITAEKVYLGFNAQDQPIGYAIVGAEPGFQDIIQLIFGYDAADHEILGMRVLDSKETPGLGDRIMSDSTFRLGFTGAVAPIEGVKAGAGDGDPEEVDMITGATISSRAVIGIINHRVKALGTMLEDYTQKLAGGTQ